MGTQLDSQNLAEIDRSFRTVFFETLGQAPRWSDLMTEVIPMTKGSTVIKWAARTAGVNEWLDERIKSKLRSFSFPVVAKKWSNGLIIDRAELEDEDNGLGIYRSQITDIADDFLEHRHQLVIDLLNNGFAATLGLAYDGQFFFDSDHPNGTGVVSNVSNLPLTAANYRTVRNQFRRLRRPNGMLANVWPTHIIVPPDLEGTAEDIFVVNRLANGADNPNYKSTTLIVEPRLTSATAWFLLDASKALKPILFGDREKVTFASVTANDAEAVFERDLLKFGGRARYNAVYMFWQTMIGSTGV